MNAQRSESRPRSSLSVGPIALAPVTPHEQHGGVRSPPDREGSSKCARQGSLAQRLEVRIARLQNVFDSAEVMILDPFESDGAEGGVHRSVDCWTTNEEFAAWL